MELQRKIRILLPALIVFNLVAWMDPFKDLVQEGNTSYGNGKYDESIEKYKKSEKYLPGKDSKYGLSFNKGNALYKKGKYEEALDNFKYSLGSANREIQKRAFFNMGNASLKMGKYKEAMESYMNALKIDPNYEKAKKNIEYMLKNNKNQDKNKDNNKNGQGKDGNDKKSKPDKGDDKNDGKSGNKQTQKKMNREQIENILKSMKNKPVRRQKGRGDGRKTLEKYW